MTELIALVTRNHELANVFAAIASAFAALVSFVVAGLSLWVTYSTLKHQRLHDELSLRPLPEVTVADWETKLRVTLRNNGSGPLIVTALVAGNGAETKPSVLDWMPELPEDIAWTSFSGPMNGRSVLPGGSITLLELEGDDADEAFVQVRDQVRAALRELTVNVEYTDVYNKALPPHRKALDWFGRHLVES